VSTVCQLPSAFELHMSLPCTGGIGQVPVGSPVANGQPPRLVVCAVHYTMIVWCMQTIYVVTFGLHMATSMLLLCAILCSMLQYH
jgi:hypothetical protein